MKKKTYCIATIVLCCMVNPVVFLQSADFVVPPVKGEYYSDLVPDTLDMAHRAELAIQGMTDHTDPEVAHDIYFLSIFYQNPPILRHQFSDICSVKYFEAVPLLRLSSGSLYGKEVERAWMKEVLGSIGEDGFWYIDTSERPWMQGTDMFAWCPNIAWPDGTIDNPANREIEKFSDSVMIGRILAPFTIYYLQSDDPVWVERCKKMIDRMYELIIDKGDYAYLPARLHVPGAKIPDEAPMPVGLNAEELGGRLIHGLTQFYRETGHEPAKELAGKLVNYMRYRAHFFDAEGQFVDAGFSSVEIEDDKERQREEPYVMGENILKVGGHFHGHTIALLSILDYAITVDDRELLEFCSKSYEWARDEGYGNGFLGWFPEGVAPEYPVSELCCIADMIALGIKLSQAGAGDYWDDVDRWTRNFFVEAQLTRVGWIDHTASQFEETDVAPNETAERVAERSKGTFSAYVTGNDYGIEHGAPTGTAACCVGNSARTIYYIWESILESKDKTLKVNLLLNRAAAVADLHSYLPYEGQVDLKIKKDLEKVLVRMPEWISEGSSDVVCKKGDQLIEFVWQGRFVDLGEAKVGDTFSVRFPIEERVVTEHVGNRDFTYTLKGNTVVAVEPMGKFKSLFQRDHYRENQARWVKVERFVPDEEIEW